MKMAKCLARCTQSLLKGSYKVCEFGLQGTNRKSLLDNIPSDSFINSRLCVYYLPITFLNLLLLFDVSENGEELVDVPLEELCAGHSKISMPQFDCLVKEVVVHTPKMSVLLSHERFQ